MTLRDKIQEKRLGIQRIKDLPPLPLVGLRVLQTLNKDDVTITEIASVIEQDPALSARIVGLANSAFFGRAGTIKTIKQAIIGVLGFDTVKSLAFSMVMSGVFDSTKCRGFQLERYWSSAMMTAVLASILSQYVRIAGDFRKQHVYLCGLLHNLGLLALVHSKPTEMSKVFMSVLAEPQKPLTVCERELLGTDHHQVGGWLGRKWQLPTETVTVIEHYHNREFRSGHWQLVLLIGFCADWVERWMQGNAAPPETTLVFDALGIRQEDLDAVRSRFRARYEDIKQVAQQIACKLRMDTHPFIEAAQELRRRFVALVDSLSGLRALSALNKRPRTEAELLGEALKILVQNQDLERCSVFLLNGDKLVCAVGRDWTDHMQIYDACPDHRPYVFRLGEGIIGRAAQNRVLMHSKNCALDARFLPLDGLSASGPVGSLISVPILAGNQLLGVLNAFHPDPNFFHPWHNNILSIFSNILGQMLGYHRLLARLKGEVNKRTRHLKQALKEAQELKLRYEQLSVVDDLTKLYNRRFFFPEAEAELSRAIRHREPFSIMLLDVDHFKQINDTYGHSLGDEVLRDIAVALANQTRDGDILARFGGEEFVLALPVTGVAGAKQLAQRIRKAVRALQWQAKRRKTKVTLSIGLTALELIDTPRKKEPHYEMILEQLLKEADLALYYCKEHGRDQIKTYQELPKDSKPSPVV